MLWVLVLTAAFMVAEAIGGWLAGSLALIADAGHMLSDTAALALAWAGCRMARRPSDALFAVAAWIVFEAVGRLRSPVPVLGVPMLAVAVAGLAVNLVAFFVLRAGDRDNLNVRAALLHVIGDLLGSVGAIAAAIVILATGWTPIDPILSILMTALILRGAWDVTSRAAHVLMEGAPDGFDVAALRADLMATVPGVTDVHHVHAWMLTVERPLVTLHVCLASSVEPNAALAAIKTRLRDGFGIAHSTVQIDPADCPD
jgi:cobalt-zinc-cadmium efflux system protein